MLVSPLLPTVATIGGAVGAGFAPLPHAQGGPEIRPEVAGEVGPGPEPAPKPPPKSGPGSPPPKKTLTPTFTPHDGPSEGKGGQGTRGPCGNPPAYPHPPFDEIGSKGPVP